ncbi:iron-siderophore ABC transporter substrate-binding protein [Nostocales cyanobacterium LEGE 11386]|nr:iron-siderophore ABC transporter substrate-binding protein [Nostocales cyanobacterium LEGE 11386]
MIKFLHRYIKLCFLIILSLILFNGCYSNSTKITELPKAKLAASKCRVIKHSLGESCIPLNPQRVIALDEVMMEVLLALDLKPIATAQPNITGSKIQKLGKKAEGIVSLGKESQPNLEKMVQLNPDLILGSYLGVEQYKLFSQIAPTVTLDYVQSAWQDDLLRIGEIIGKSTQAQKILEQYQQRVQELRTVITNKLASKKISVIRFYAGRQNTEFRTKFSFPVSLILDVGLSLPEVQNQLTNNSDQTSVLVSLERADLINADVIFVALDPGAEDAFQQYQNSQLWQKLKAVENNRVYTVDSGYWIFGNILSANVILDDIWKYLLKDI